jgi:hypothetical protein
MNMDDDYYLTYQSKRLDKNRRLNEYFLPDYANIDLQRILKGGMPKKGKNIISPKPTKRTTRSISTGESSDSIPFSSTKQLPKENLLKKELNTREERNKEESGREWEELENSGNGEDSESKRVSEDTENIPEKMGALFQEFNEEFQQLFTQQVKIINNLKNELNAWKERCEDQEEEIVELKNRLFYLAAYTSRTSNNPSQDITLSASKLNSPNSIKYHNNEYDNYLNNNYINNKKNNTKNINNIKKEKNYETSFEKNKNINFNKKEKKYDPICRICNIEHDFRECLRKFKNYTFSEIRILKKLGLEPKPRYSVPKESERLTEDIPWIKKLLDKKYNEKKIDTSSPQDR